MAGQSKIEWTEITWNPTTGCDKVSQGCKYCYAERWALMQQKRGLDQYKHGFKFTIATNKLNDPFTWRHPKLVFVNSMSDLFHEKMPLEYLQRIFHVMESTPQHTYQILTKRTTNLKRLAGSLKWSKNIWLGVSVENNNTKYRIDVLRSIPASIKFISFEPLLEEMHGLSLERIDWVIVGGESGGKARPINKNWVSNLQIQCSGNGIPFFFKQWGKSIFNPDQLDPTMKRTDRNYAKGGCLVGGSLFRQLPS